MTLDRAPTPPVQAAAPVAADEIASLPRYLHELAQEALTWVETQEADAVRFGIFDATTRGEEVGAHFAGRRIADTPCAEPDVLHALRILRTGQHLVLLRTDLDQPEAPAGWTFR